MQKIYYITAIMLHNLRYSLFLATLFALATISSFSQEQEQKQENKIRYGGRVANASSLLINSPGYDYFSLEGYGFGWALGAVASIPIANTITFNPEINLIYRGLYMMDEATMSEFAISLPALFQYMPFGGPLFYLEAGTQLDIPFARDIDNGYSRYYNGYSQYYQDYEFRDIFLGIPLGLGWHIGQHFVIDYRIVIDLLAYGHNYADDMYARLGLIQEELSLLYLF